MGLIDWLRGGNAVAEAASLNEADTAPPVIPPSPSRKGFETGIPIGGTGRETARLHVNERRSQLEELYQVYLTCPWVSRCIDTTAQTVTAGGLAITTDEDVPEGKAPPEPASVARLRALIDWCNPREDTIQLLRSTVTDLMVFGDAYVEIVWLLGEPVALYTLDASCMQIVADEHGEVQRYVQVMDDGMREATFEPNEVVHISMDAPRGGLYGVSPVSKVLLTVTAWLFTAATLKEDARKGFPPRIHQVFSRGTKPADIDRWWSQYVVRNLGAKNTGVPATSIEGKTEELSRTKVIEVLEALRQLRDEIISGLGMVPSKVGVIESGNLGGGTGEAQDKTMRVNLIIPLSNLVLEKLNFSVVRQGFGITGWHLEFDEVDMRDSKVVEEIRDMRLRNGSYTLNRYRGEIGEPAVMGGDDPVLVQRQEVLFWSDMADYSAATIDKLAAGAELPEPLAANARPSTASRGNAGRGRPGGPGDAAQGKPPRERGSDADARLSETWVEAYRRRRRQTLDELPKGEDDG